MQVVWRLLTQIGEELRTHRHDVYSPQPALISVARHVGFLEAALVTEVVPACLMRHACAAIHGLLEERLDLEAPGVVCLASAPAVASRAPARAGGRMGESNRPQLVC